MGAFQDLKLCLYVFILNIVPFTIIGSMKKTNMTNKIIIFFKDIVVTTTTEVTNYIANG